jgi:uncharacterized membrane protein YeaQ/YmgE (transglycosylase-associated protein family)
MFTYKLADTLTNNDKRGFTIIMICGILGITLAYTVFNNGSYKNHSLKYGLLIGSLILLVYNIIVGWNEIDNDMKLLIISTLLGIIIYFSY